MTRSAKAAERPFVAGRPESDDDRDYIGTVTTSRATKVSELNKLRVERGGDSPVPKNPRTRLFVITAAIVAFIGIATLAALLLPSVPEVQTVRARLLGTDVSTITLSATGYIVAHHKIDVNSKVTGRVKWIGVEKGDHVTAGQVILELEDDEFKAQLAQARGQVLSARAYLQQLEAGPRTQEIAQARDNLDQARATLRNDQITLDRTRQLAHEGIVPLQQLDDAEARYEADAQRVASLAEAYALVKLGPRQEEIQRAQGSLMQAEGQLAYAQAQLAATRIRAPSSGTVLERTAEPGELVTSAFASAPGGPLDSMVSLADLKDLQVELDIPQDALSKLHARQRASVTTDAYPDRKYNGVITEVAPEANRQKATVQVKVQIENPGNDLRPDMNATVQFLPDAPETAHTARGLFVPARAIRTDRGRQFVLVAYDGRAIARSVRIVSRRADGVVVDGLSGGEDVIVNSSRDVEEGSRIKQKE